MNPEQLLAHFDRISEAPDAIPRLRRFILDLAVRGKLVEQDPREEPASELLKRIQAEKERLVKAGEIRKENPFPRVEAEETPFASPAGWEWVRIRQVTSDRGQATPDNDFTYIDVTAINKEVGRVADAKVLSASDAPSRARKLVRTGDVLYSCVRPYLLNIAVIESDIVPSPIASTAFAVLNGFGLILSKYLWIALRSPFMVECVEGKMRGQAYPAINDSDFALLPLPLPPLAEQQCIVVKVDELMALCDRLETAKTERESRRDRLLASSLNRLNNGADPIAFRDHARFYFNHLPRLTTRHEHVKKLRGTILNLAFQGWLTFPWRETAEIVGTAQEFRRSVENARKKAWDKKQVAGSSRKYLSPIEFDRENLPMIPDSWVWASADAVCSQITDGEHIQPRYQPEGLPMLTAKHVREGFVTFEDSELISESDFKKCVARCKPEEGDILVVSVGATTGRAAIVSQTRPFALVRSVLLLKPLLSPAYFLRWLQSPWCFVWMRQASEASAQPHLYIGDTKRMPVPLPPLAEQQRIVTKVDELMALCDRLETQLTTTQTESRRLLEATLHHALSA